MLNKLALTNFRSYEQATFEFDKITLLLGPNGVGKTNALEAISFLSLGRSFRTKHAREAIRWGSEVARLVGEADEVRVEVAITLNGPNKKFFKVDGVPRRAIDLLGRLPIIIFTPDSLNLVAGPPHLRRQFLDLLLIQKDRLYAYHLIQLQKILRQRNRLLRAIRDGQAEEQELVFWDKEMVSEASRIAAARVLVLRSINKTINAQYEQMSQKKGGLQLNCKAASASESAGEQAKFRLPSDAPAKALEWAKILGQNLVRYRAREIAAGASLYGPQRDDWYFVLAGRALSTFGSRGEGRSAILALLACEAGELLNPREGKQELLFLLDDVFSELDVARRTQLAGLIGPHQAIMTSADIGQIDDKLRSKAKIIDLTEKGSHGTDW